MFCSKCGATIDEGARFCAGCGTPTSTTQIHGATAPGTTIPQRPPHWENESPAPWQTSQPAAPPTPQYYAPPPTPRRKRRKGCIIAVVVLLVLLIGIGWLVSSLIGLLGPRDLGVRYTEADYQSAMTKVGTQVTFDGMSGEELRTYAKKLKTSGEKFPIADYEWSHSDYVEKSFELTPAEATALVNEIAPAFFWFENSQIQVNPDGTVEGSGTLLLSKAVMDLYPDIKDEIPFPLLPKVSLSAKGGISIQENQLLLDPDEFKTGPIEGISPDMLAENAFFFEPLYTSVPGLMIHSLTVNDKGNFEVDALIPQKTVVTKKGS